jgi:hypothetical protein
MHTHRISFDSNLLPLLLACIFEPACAHGVLLPYVGCPAIQQNLLRTVDCACEFS